MSDVDRERLKTEKRRLETESFFQRDLLQRLQLRGITDAEEINAAHKRLVDIEKRISEIEKYLQSQKGNRFLMAEWTKVLTAAATIAAATKTLAGFAGDIWHWFESRLDRAGDRQAQQVWEDFRKDPAKHKDDLINVAMRLEPDGDPLLEQYVLGIARQESRERANRVYALLSSKRYTFDQVENIGRRMGITRETLGKGYNKSDIADRTVEYAKTREDRWNDLIGYMLVENPEVIDEIIKLVYD